MAATGAAVWMLPLKQNAMSLRPTPTLNAQKRRAWGPRLASLVQTRARFTAVGMTTCYARKFNLHPYLMGCSEGWEK